MDKLKMDRKKKFYITTPIFYPNSVLHLGHAYTMVIADCIARYKQIDGYEVHLQTGSDEHGEKIIRTSLSLGFTPQQLVDRNIEFFKELWKNLNIIEQHSFVRTSNQDHKKKVQEIFSFLQKKGDIYLGNYEGSYCLVCEEYISNSEKCTTCNGNLVKVSEEAYFLRVEKYRSLLIGHYKNNESFLLPQSSLNELSHSFLAKKIPDLCITRKSLEWGIEVPGRPGMTIYVWFDALLNYITSEKGEKFFSSSEDSTQIVHIVGKDIIRFHGIYWILLLFSMNKRLPDKLIAHGWILSSGNKMSKSKGNVIDPLSLLTKYKSDVLRSYFCSKIVLYQDGILSEELLSSFYQEFFVKKLSNLLARTSRMIELYNKGVVPAFKNSSNPLLIKYFGECFELVDNYRKKMDSYSLTAAFADIQLLLDLTNKLISESLPWKLFVEENHQILHEVLNALVNGIKIASFLLIPFAPDSSPRIMSKFGIRYSEVNFANLLCFENVNGSKIEQDSAHLFT